MVASKYLTHFCYPIRLVSSISEITPIVYPGIPPKSSSYTPWQCLHWPSHLFLRKLRSKSGKTSSPEKGFLTRITLALYIAQPHFARNTKRGQHL